MKVVTCQVVQLQRLSSTPHNLGAGICSASCRIHQRLVEIFLVAVAMVLDALKNQFSLSPWNLAKLEVRSVVADDPQRQPPWALEACEWSG